MNVMRTAAGGKPEARARLRVAIKYLEVAQLAGTEPGQAVNNVVVGISVLSGIAAGDVLCLLALGKRYSGTDHAEGVRLLATVDPDHAKALATLVRLKPPAHYGHSFLNEADRIKALRAASVLVVAAQDAR